ncbi:g9959 [Coccomyxa elongata]
MLSSRTELSFLEQATDLPVLPLLLLCVCIAWKVTQSRQRRALHAAEARATAAAAAAAAAAGATSECFTTEWANQLLRALWPSTLEPRAAAKVQQKLDAALLKVLKERAQKGPLRYVERIFVEHVSLGNAPPMLHTVRVQSSPADELLRLDFGLGFAPAAGFRVVLALMVRPTKMLPAIAVHVEVANVKLHGSCRLDLTLAPDQPPGISALAISFLQPPVFSFDFVPFGLPVGELPYVLDMLKDQLQAVLSARMVEPNRISISIGQDAAVQADSPGVARKAMGKHLDMPDEHLQPALSVPERPSWMLWRGRAARVTAMQTAVTAVAEPVAAEAEYEITNTLIFGLDEEDSSLLEAEGDQGAVRQGLKPYPNEQPSDSPEDGTKKSLQHVVHVSAACTAAVAGAAQQESRAVDIYPMINGQCIKSDSETLDTGVLVPSTPKADPQEEPTSPHTLLGFAFLAVTAAGEGSTPEGLAASEPAADGDLSVDDKAQLAACKALADVTANLEALRRRIAAERLRALVEGAPFLVHAAPGPKQQIVWYSQSEKALRWADEKGDTTTAQALHLAAASCVTAGAADFPQQAAGEKGKMQTWSRIKLWRRNAAPDAQWAVVDNARSLSVWSSDKTALHLELPSCGNGRSRREWMDAITDVIGSSGTVSVVLGM